MYIPLLSLVVSAVIFLVTTGLLYLFVRKKTSYGRLVGAYAVSAIGNLVLFFIFPIPVIPGVPQGVLVVLDILLVIGLTFLVFYGAMRWILSISWKRSLAMFVVVFLFALPLLQYLTTSLLAASPIVDAPVVREEFHQQHGNGFEHLLRVLSGNDPVNSLVLLSESVSTAVSNWQIEHINHILWTASY